MALRAIVTVMSALPAFSASDDGTVTSLSPVNAVPEPKSPG